MANCTCITCCPPPLQDPKKKKWGVTDAALDALAAAMLVTILLDLWRISFGSILGAGGEAGGLPWM